eukprot:GHVS01007552.1.p1 GENE.GHVS01007552.1~~GHVS01007552.1.p1  ORF type:complete len:368 (-),score=30.22 GHVS01007552.1:271-1374(-)
MGAGQEHRRTIGCGLAAGTVQSVLFNPWDRAMYLSVKSKRPFFDRANWNQPYQGFGQAILHRTLSNGLYFPFETFFSGFFVRRSVGAEATLHDLSVHPHLSCSELVLVGILSGACSGFILHPLSAIKYRCWGFESTPTFTSAVSKFYSAGHLRSSLARGLVSTLQRDIIFGGCFCFLRHKDGRHIWPEDKNVKTERGDLLATRQCPHTVLPLDHHQPPPPLASSPPLTPTTCTNGPPQNIPSLHGTSTPPLHGTPDTFPSSFAPSWQDRTSQFTHNFVAAGIGVAVSSPLNFVRSVKFSHKVGQPVPSSMAILRTLVTDCLLEKHHLVARTRWIMQRLLVGVGTFRVAFGMAVGAQVYSLCVQENWD